jgi:hypothetical protein
MYNEVEDGIFMFYRMDKKVGFVGILCAERIATITLLLRRITFIVL